MAEIPLYEQLRGEAYIPDAGVIEVPGEARTVFNQAMGEWIAGDAHGFLMPPDSRDGHCDPREFIRTLALRLSALADAYNSQMTQSPIEDMLLGGLLWLEMDWAGFPKFDAFGEGPRKHEDGSYTLREDHIEFWLTSQAPIGKYKADFLLWVALGKSVGGIVIECDGHAFHERTKEQAGRDKKRDREILKAGYPVLRFTGTEVFKDPLGCVQQIKEVFSDVLFRVSKEGGLF